MSYDLYFVRVVPGQDPAAVAEAALDAEEEGVNQGPIDAAVEARKHMIAKALLQANSKLRIEGFDFRAIAAQEATTESEARRAYRHLELDEGVESRTGIQITLLDETATLTVPYWHRESAARDVWSEIWRYVDVLHAVGGFMAYDPQLERSVTQSRDVDAVLTSYLDGVAFTERVAKDVTRSSPARPWWKFWSRGA